MERKEGRSEGWYWRGPRNGGRFSWFFLYPMPSSPPPAPGLRLGWGPQALAEVAPPDHRCPSLLPRLTASDPGGGAGCAGRQLGPTRPPSLGDVLPAPSSAGPSLLAVGVVNFAGGMFDVSVSL